MIDFNNKAVFKLSLDKKPERLLKDIYPFLIDGESVINVYSALRDYVVFTNMRVIAVNVQGFTGAKKDFSSLPYSKVNAFSVETSGTFDLDSELEMYFSGLGKVRFEFSSDSDIIKIGKILSEYSLK